MTSKLLNFFTWISDMPTPMNVNTENFIKLISFLEAEGDGRTDLIFDMNYWSDNAADTSVHDNKCGSVMCIGGSCEYLAGHQPNCATTGEMGDWLGISKGAALHLFYPDGGQVHDFQSSREDIIDMLEDILTGDVIFDGTNWVRV